jgi:salicylate hydroxylase
LTYYDYIDSMYGAPWYSIHRVDLHNELKRLAQEPAAGRKGAKIRLECEVVGADFEAGTIVLSDGTVHRKDLIVAADGVHVGYQATGTEVPSLMRKTHASL